MKVATDYAMLLKTLTVEKMDLLWSSPDIMIDEVSNASTISFSAMSYKLSDYFSMQEYNIKLVNFRIDCRKNDPATVAGVDWLNINLFKLLQTVVGIVNAPQSCSYSL
ncbi:hypothetical protein H5410_048297 [Solanum commersonii]|uniref:Uncharacterized protein n=1 Tax=Solanum commersonii TaxID=4109 RepID=A0A9J5XJZ8_SOLCO|nr:hypothetical protein H5410_048297 [Solanum commersonii]